MSSGNCPGKKFDMRVYALVTSYAPLTVWLYRTGFGRFSNTRYTVDRENVDNLCENGHRDVFAVVCLSFVLAATDRHALDQCRHPKNSRELPEKERLQAEPAKDKNVDGVQTRNANN